MRSLFSPLIDALVSPIVRAQSRKVIRTGAGSLSQREVDAIVEQCGGRPGMVTLQNGELTVRAVEDGLLRGRVLSALDATGETTLRARPKIELSDFSGL